MMCMKHTTNKRNMVGKSLAFPLLESSHCISNEGKLKPENPDRLIFLSKLLNMDKKSQRHPSHNTALASHCAEA